MELNNCGFIVVNQVVNQRVTYDDAEGHRIGVVTTVSSATAAQSVASAAINKAPIRRTSGTTPAPLISTFARSSTCAGRYDKRQLIKKLLALREGQYVGLGIMPLAD